MKKLFVCVVCGFLLFACTDPMEVRIPIGADGKMSESEDFKAIVEKLPQADKDMLVGYLLRSAMAAALTNTPMTAVTIGEAITAQKKFTIEQKVKADAEAAEAAKQAAEEKAARDAHEANLKRVRDMVSGALLDKTFRPADYMRGVVQDALMFTVLFKNKTDKEITGMRGSLVLNNTLGDKISSIWITNEESIPAGGEFTWSGGLHYNQFMEDHMAMRNAELSKIVSIWQPSMIMFADGTVERLEVE